MGKVVKVQQVVNDLHTLSDAERMFVLKRLVKLMDKKKVVSRGKRQPPKLTDLAGLGKEMWEKIDVDKYIRDLRNEWD